MGYKVKPFHMNVRDNYLDEFKDVTFLGSDVNKEVSDLEQADQTLNGRIDSVNQSLNTRIDNIVAQSGDDITEIVDARTGADSTTYPSLKARLDAENSDLKNALEAYTGNTGISLTNGFYIKTNYTVGQTLPNLTPTAGSAVNNYAIVNANEGDKFTINGTGGSGARLWCFIDANLKVLAVAGAGASATNLVLTAPANADKLIVNAATGYGVMCKGIYLTDRVDVLEYKTKDLLIPELRNGSAGNTLNTNAISVKNIFPVDNFKTLLLNIDTAKIPLVSGYQYLFAYWAYSISSGKPDDGGTAQYVVQRKESIYTTDPYIYITLPSATKGLAVWLRMVRTVEGETENYPLRVENTGTDAMSVIPLYDSVEANALNDELKAKLYTQLNREAFSYLGSDGKFQFYSNTIFDANGRCAWRSTSNVIIKLPTKNTVTFTNDQIISALGNDDTYTDGDGTSWVYLRAGRALIYDDATGTIASVPINNATSSLTDKAYPLLMMWSSQAVGGLLYPKFLSDVAQKRLEDATDEANALNDELKAKLYTQLNREAFSYLGSDGKFQFYSNTIFDANGRCAWRSTSNVIIKLPTKNTVTFTNDQIISALGNDDTYTDGDGTSWVYLRAGRALIYDDATGTIASVPINNATSSLTDKAYPLLMMWSSQAVGGLLYPKFLSDVAQKRLEDATENVNERGIANTEINKKLGNAQHVAHPWTETITPQLTLLHFSDIHADASAMARIINDKDTWSYEVNDVICTGDMTANNAGQIASWWNPSILTCIGNHDSASYDASTGYDWTALSMADRDAYYIAPFESEWGIVHTAGTSYYYKDYTSQKVRLIVMDGMLYMGAPGEEATTQTAWLANLLSDAITNGLHVLIAIHAPHGGATAEVCSFSRYGQGVMPTSSNCNTPQVVIDTVATAITNGLHFIGYIVGHTHQDNMWDAEGDGSQMMYCVTCAAVAQTAQWLNSDQNRTGNLDAYNIVTIDTDHTLVKLIRGGGADIDDHMRTRKAICYNYSTGEKVGEVL